MKNKSGRHEQLRDPGTVLDRDNIGAMAGSSLSTFLPTEPTAAPTDVKATSVSVSEILVTWKHIKESLGRPQGFEV